VRVYRVAKLKKSEKQKNRVSKMTEIDQMGEKSPENSETPPRPIRTLTSSVTFGESVALGPSRKRFPARSSWGVDVMLHLNFFTSRRRRVPSLPPTRRDTKCSYRVYPAVTDGALQLACTFLQSSSNLAVTGTFPEPHPTKVVGRDRSSHGDILTHAATLTGVGYLTDEPVRQAAFEAGNDPQASGILRCF
jgi:hypothetical protein